MNRGFSQKWRLDGVASFAGVTLVLGVSSGLGAGAVARAGDPACANWSAKSCAQVGDFRKQKIAGAPVTMVGFGCVDPNAGNSAQVVMGQYGTSTMGSSMTVAQKLSDSQPGFTRTKFLSCMHGVSDKLRDLQRQDTDLITKELKASGYTGINYAQVNWIFTSPASTFVQSYGQTQTSISQIDYKLNKTKLGAATTGTLADEAKFSKWALRGPYGTLKTAVFAQGTSRVNPNLEIFKGPNGSELTPQQTVDRLTQIAQRGSDPMNGGYEVEPNPSDNEVNPTTAKMILFEMLRQRLLAPTYKRADGSMGPDPANVKKLQETIWQLNLKFDHSEPYCRMPGAEGTDVGGLPVCSMPGSQNGQHGTSKTWQTPGDIDPMSVTIHNGYYYGSETLHDPTLAEPRSANQGFDCTSLISKCMRDSGLPMSADGVAYLDLSSRVLSSINTKTPVTWLDPVETKSLAQAKKLFDAVDFECEAQLKPGDIIAFNGHALVFDGYKLDSAGRPQFTSLEAAGGPYRSVGNFYRDIYGSSNTCDWPDFGPELSKGQVKIIRVKGDP